MALPVFYGSAAGTTLNQPIVGMAPSVDGRGYWLVASDGGVFSFGDAPFEGSTGAMHLNQPIVGMVPTPDGQGYWLVASDGGVFTFGDAGFYGSLGAITLQQAHRRHGRHEGWPRLLARREPTAESSPSATLPFYGSLGGTPLNKPIVGIAPARNGNGYVLAASDGGVFTFGASIFYGSAGAGTSEHAGRRRRRHILRQRLHARRVGRRDLQLRRFVVLRHVRHGKSQQSHRGIGLLLSTSPLHSD